jgi:N-acetylmuramoyl-L-alanine amidase
MPNVRSSVRCAGTDARALLVRPLLFAAVAIVCGASVYAQPVLRLGGTPGSSVEGVPLAGAAAFPVRTLELLGFQLAADPASFSAVSGGDTLRFWVTSPFFRAGRNVHQLTHPVQRLGTVVYVPEQFFIQWLPSTYPERFQYRDGLLYRVDAVAVTPAAAHMPVPRTQATEVAPPPAGERAPAQAQRSAPQPRSTPRVVVIDPGHGGRDPGKVGPNGLREKDVTLMISQRLAAMLRDRGYEVHLTRTTDTLIALADRPRLANQWKGDRPVAVFLSIHANSATVASARGFETFFLSEARTEDERRVAEMENESIRFEDTPRQPAANGLDQILNNLRNDFLMRASHDLASVLQEKMAAFHPGPNRGVKRAGFYVLVGSIMPAVLIETAFISNRDEASLLGTQAFQQKLAFGIADAVDEFFRRNEHLWIQD